MSNTSYWLYQRYVKYGNSEYVPVFPAEYAISGDTGQDPVLKQDNDPNCGYCETEYRWHTLPIGEEYICSGGNKYYKEVYQVSTDCGFNWENVVPESARTGNLYESGSSDCIEYRWVNMDISTDWVCSGISKYYKQKKQWKYTDSSTWQDVTPAEYQMGALYEEESVDCGYVHDYSKDYLTFIPTSGSSTFGWNSASGTASGNTVQYSLDSGETWSNLSSGQTVTVNQGNKILWKASGLAPTSFSGIGKFSSTGNFTVEGNAMSLYYGDNFVNQTSLSGKHYALYGLFSGNTNVTSAENLSLPATTLAYYCYADMFRDCTSLTTAPELPATTLSVGSYLSMFWGCTSLTTAPELPATTLANQCYGHMFLGCTSLTTAPSVLPATTVKRYCYGQMFYNCTSLTTAPSVLPATTLAENCYQDMFAYCTNLTTAPSLPATTLTSECYNAMFSNCTSLNSVTCLATDISASYCTTNWLYNVSSNGTFTKAASMSGWTTGVNGIPSNWTVQNYS